jgi:hypothetical protein
MNTNVLPSSANSSSTSQNIPVSALAEGTYAWWRAAAENLLTPLAALMKPGKADLPLRGRASNHGAQADRLESFARPCLLAAHWFASEPAASEKISRDEIASWFRRGLLVGTDPASPEYWGPTANHHQHTVEMAALTLALQIARSSLWEPLSKLEREQVMRWFASIRGAGLHRNNHMFFSVMTLAFLNQEGFAHSSDTPVMRHLLDVLESMSLGGGWFIDGMNETVDYYQAYAFHYYGPWWAKLYGHTDPERARRWKDWTRQFLKDYIHFFAASGENPPFGRSQCYRFAASAPFGLAEFCGVSAIPPGQARRVCTRNLGFFLRHTVLQEQGALSLGWTDEFPELTEAYSCAGSPYWAAKGFAPLLLSPTHRFWQATEERLPSERSDFQIAVPQAGLVVRSHDGDVEVLNNANGICVGNIAFGTWKWGKLSFRSGVGGEIALSADRYPLDAGLTAEFANGTVYGRHQCQPVAVATDHCASVYALGDRYTQNQASIETHLWWNGGWQLQWHRVAAYQPTIFRAGTYSLPLKDASAKNRSIAAEFAHAENAECGVAIQPLLGFGRIQAHESDPQHRAHILSWHSLVLAVETDAVVGEQHLMALVWIGRMDRERAPWKIQSSTEGKLTLRHPALGTWPVAHPELPKLPVSQ